MRIVVTGAGGHVGSNLVDALLRDGDEVCAVDIVRGANLPPGVDFEQADVRDEARLTRCFAGADVVFHLAARISIDGDRDGQVHAINVEGARSAARAALRAGVGRYVHFSSVHAFDSRAGGTITEDSPRATGPAFAAYDRSKAGGEAAVRGVVGEGLDAVIVHPSAVVGAVDPAPSRTGRTFLDAARGRLPVIVSGAFDWVNVLDVVVGARAAAARGERGRSFILSGEHVPLRELMDLAAARAGAPAPLLALPRGLLRPFATLPTLIGRLRGREALFTVESLDTLATRARFSHARAERELGYWPRHGGETVEALIDWFVNSGRLEVAQSIAAAQWQPDFARQLRAFPLDGAAAVRALGPLLAEIALADGRLERSELELLTQFAAVPESDGLLSLDAPEDREALLETLSPGQRESVLMVAMALAWVDEEHSAVERAAIETLRAQLGVAPGRAGVLEDWARDYVVDQLLDAVYADGVMDAQERERVDEMAGRLSISPDRLHRLDERARRRRGIV